MLFRGCRAPSPTTVGQLLLPPSLPPSLMPAWPGESHILSWMASVMGCGHFLRPVHPEGSWSASPETSSSRPITEVRHPENLLTEPFSLNCKQIGGFECYATRLWRDRGASSQSCGAGRGSAPRRSPHFPSAISLAVTLPGWLHTLFIFFKLSCIAMWLASTDAL